jgi:hypothetical protein
MMIFKVAGKQGFATPYFYKLFKIIQLRAMLLKTRNFIFSYCFVCFDIFSHFLPSDGHKMDTSLSQLLHKIIAMDLYASIHSHRRESTGLDMAALMVW